MRRAAKGAGRSYFFFFFAVVFFAVVVAAALLLVFFAAAFFLAGIPVLRIVQPFLVDGDIIAPRPLPRLGCACRARAAPSVVTRGISACAGGGWRAPWRRPCGAAAATGVQWAEVSLPSRGGSKESTW